MLDEAVVCEGVLVVVATSNFIPVSARNGAGGTVKRVESLFTEIAILG
jgi:hypothetical protein